MKTLKKITLVLLTLLTLSSVFGYFYFEQKFTPEKNYLIVKNQSGKTPITWQGGDKKALLIPIHFEGDTTIHYLQFDTGSPYTLFYKKAVQKLKQIKVKNETAKATFFIGQAKIYSSNFKLIDNGEKLNSKDTIKIIGTLGSDILENRKTLLNFRENYVELNLNQLPNLIKSKLLDFDYKKRKIIISGILKEKKEHFLYDSGTSAYELITNQDIWNDLKMKNSKTIIEKSKSWQNILTTYTTRSNHNIIFSTKQLPLKNVTYVEGFSKTQYLLMKLSGMTGMLGNKVFLDNILYIDCFSKKMAIE